MRGLSNSVSDFLESVANSIPDSYEVISSEDMLARVEAGNEVARKIIDEGRKKKMEKLRCKEQGESCMEMVERCGDAHRVAVERGSGETEMHPQQPSEERWNEMLI